MRRFRTFAGICASIIFSLMFIWFVCEKSIVRQIHSQAQFRGFPQVTIGSIKPTLKGFKIQNLILSNHDTQQTLSIDLLKFNLSLKSFFSKEFELVVVSGLSFKTDPKYVKDYLMDYFEESSIEKSHIRHLKIKGETELVLGDSCLKSPLIVTYDKTDAGSKLRLCIDVDDKRCSGHAYLHVNYERSQTEVALGFDDFNVHKDADHYSLKNFKASLKSMPTTAGEAQNTDAVFSITSSPLSLNGTKILTPQGEFWVTSSKGKGKFHGKSTFTLRDNPITITADSDKKQLSFKLSGQDLSLATLAPLINLFHKTSPLEARGHMSIDLKANLPFDFDQLGEETFLPAFLGKFVEMLFDPKKSGDLILNLKDVYAKNEVFDVEKLCTNLHLSLFPLKSSARQRISAQSITYKDTHLSNLNFDFLYSETLKPFAISFSIPRGHTNNASSLHFHSFRDNADNGRTFIVDVKGVEAEDIIPFMNVKDLSLRGTFSGQGQFLIDSEDRLKLLNAKLSSSSPKGHLQYTPQEEGSLHLASETNETNKTNALVVERMLKNFHFSLLSLLLTSEQNKLNLKADVTGFNPHHYRGHPFRFQFQSSVDNVTFPNFFNTQNWGRN